jgi:hypothetical protein
MLPPPLCTHVLFQEKAAARQAVMTECQTDAGHQHYMERSFKPYMKMLESNASKTTKSDLEAVPLNSKVEKSSESSLSLRVGDLFVSLYACLCLAATCIIDEASLALQSSSVCRLVRASAVHLQ